VGRPGRDTVPPRSRPRQDLDPDSAGIDAIQNILPELEPSPGPVLMICTNSRRDVCCSVRGRPVAIESASQRPGQVWECSHTGGHRLAPTGVLLPHGQTFGRLSSRSAVAAVDAAMRDEVPAELLGATYDRGAATSARRDRQPNPWCDSRSGSPVCLPSRPRRRPAQVRRTPGNAGSVTSMDATGTWWLCVVPVRLTCPSPAAGTLCRPGNGPSHMREVPTQYPHNLRTSDVTRTFRRAQASMR